MSPLLGGSSEGLPSRVECLSPQEVNAPATYGTTASPLRLKMRGPAAWQATPSLAVYRLACHRLLPGLGATFALVPSAARPGFEQRPWGIAPVAGPVGWLGRPSVSDPWGVVCCNQYFGHPSRACVCRVHGSLALVQPCAHCTLAPWRWFSGACALCIGCTVSMAPWRSFTGACALRIVCAVSIVCWCSFTVVRTLWVVCAVSMAPCRLITGAGTWRVIYMISMAPWRSFPGVRALCVVCAVSKPLWCSFTGMRILSVVCAVSMALQM